MFALIADVAYPPLDPNPQAIIAAAACVMLVLGVAGIMACLYQLMRDEE